MIHSTMRRLNNHRRRNSSNFQMRLPHFSKALNIEQKINRRNENIKSLSNQNNERILNRPTAKKTNIFVQFSIVGCIFPKRFEMNDENKQKEPKKIVSEFIVEDLPTPRDTRCCGATKKVSILSGGILNVSTSSIRIKFSFFIKIFLVCCHHRRGYPRRLRRPRHHHYFRVNLQTIYFVMILLVVAVVSFPVEILFVRVFFSIFDFSPKKGCILAKFMVKFFGLVAWESTVLKVLALDLRCIAFELTNTIDSTRIVALVLS